MAKESNIKADGTVLEALPGGQFKVEIENGSIVTCVLSGKMRMHYIKVIPGDSVVIEMSVYDLSKGRICIRK